MDEHTKVYGAFGAGGELIGVIESNGERDALAFGSRKSVNIGRYMSCRNTGAPGYQTGCSIFAESRSGADFAWVEHGLQIRMRGGSGTGFSRRINMKCSGKYMRLQTRLYSRFPSAQRNDGAKERRRFLPRGFG